MQNKYNQLYTEYTTILRNAADNNYAVAVLGWDQEVNMPPKGAAIRGRQLATLASQAHSLLTSQHLETILKQLADSEELAANEKNNVRLSLLDFEKNKKIPAAFVKELTVLTNECFNCWLDARKKNDYTVFAPYLAKMIRLKKQQAEYYGYEKHPYDALMNDYEKGATVAGLDPVFKRIGEKMPILLNKIKNAPQVSNQCYHLYYPKQQQWDFSIEVLTKMGFDFEAGRQDYSEHPFTTSFSPCDVRLTTRVDEYNFASLLWSCIHEGGHGLYEQGLPEKEYGLPLCEATSLGIHESQSRLWENNLGRSLHFWSYFYPILQRKFPQQLESISLNEFYKGANRVEPSLIRTEADELTYHFHIMIRYEIEKLLIEGSLQPKDVRAFWNDYYKKYLGISPTDDKTGVLQDVHWSHGSFGYFPTYTLGSMYAAQFFEQAKTEIPNLNIEIANGQFSSLLSWLRKKIHHSGRTYTSNELAIAITGKGLDADLFMNYLDEKYTKIYNL